MRFLLALGLAAAFAATAPAGFAQTSSGNSSVPITSQPGVNFQGGAAAKKGQYQQGSGENGSVPTTSQPGAHFEGGAAAKKGQYQKKQ